MTNIRLIQHAPGAPGLRLLGLGPNLVPNRGLRKLKCLFDSNAFWASDRKLSTIRRILAGSSVVVSLWRRERMVGFGRATSDGISRAVLWDIVIANDLQGNGLGRKVVEALVNSHQLINADRIYLMTTYRSEFYEQLGFKKVVDQSLLMLDRK